MEIKKMHLTPNKYTRPQIDALPVKGIVVHYNADPMANAEDIQAFFENCKDGRGSFRGYNYIIGLEGQIIEMTPPDERTYHCGAAQYEFGIQQKLSSYPNNCTIGIGTCHTDEDGNYTRQTKYSLINLLAYLCHAYDLNPLTDIYRHFDVTGKICPKYYVFSGSAWKRLKQSVAKIVGTKQYIKEPKQTIKQIKKQVEKEIGKNVKAEAEADFLKNIGDGEIQVDFLGEKISTTAYLVNGKALVHVRDLFEKLGYKVSYSQTKGIDKQRKVKISEKQ